MKDDDFKLLGGFDLWQTNGQTDICDCRVTFATEKQVINPAVDRYHMSLNCLSKMVT